MNGESQPSGNAVRGLTTLAMLKANFDAGRDHIAMFQPFLLDTIRANEDDDFDTEEIRNKIQRRHGLKIPRETLSILLTRATKNSYIRREGGRYFRIPERIYRGSDIVDVRQEREVVSKKYRSVGAEFVAFAKDRGRTIASPEGALELIVRFLAKFEADILLGDYPPIDVLEKKELERRDYILVGRFIQERCLPSDRLRGALGDLLEGYVLQNALFLKDIGSPQRDLSHLIVYFDSGFLLGLLGLEGKSIERACREAVELLKKSNVGLRAFERSIREMKRILALYERKLGTQEGRASLRRTELTRYFLTNQYTPADVKQASALIKKNLRTLGIRVVETPERRREFTLNEGLLADRLTREDEGPDEPRVVHDVNCTAAILTLRGGRTADRLEDARHVFASDSPGVISTIRKWFEDEGRHGVPPFVYHRKLTNLVWLRDPSAATEMKESELAALCAAGLRPSQALWNSFIGHLENLVESGEITDEEAVAIVADELTDELLVDVEGRPSADAEDLSEVIQRVKDKYRQEADERVARATAEAMSEREQRRQLEIRISWIADKIGFLLSGAAYVLLQLAVIAGLAVLAASRTGESAWGAGVAIITSIVALWNMVRGGNLRTWRRSWEAWLTRKIRTQLLGN